MPGRAARRDRTVILLALTIITLLAWLYLADMARGMANMAASVIAPQSTPWSPTDFLLTFLMWVVMMVGMMLPSAAPMFLVFAAASRTNRPSHEPISPTAAFGLGYGTVWTGFSLGATVLQWGLHRASLLSPMMTSTSAALAGWLFVIAGIYQWSPLKLACLRHCRSPFHFILTRWRSGYRGAFAMGIEHGTFCLGCCWFLMGLLFAVGVMNLAWVAVISAVVLLEKAAPGGRRMARTIGVGMVVFGVWTLLR